MHRSVPSSSRDDVRDGKNGLGDRCDDKGYNGTAVAVDLVAVVWYKRTMVEIERVQTGVRMEKRLLKVLKALAEYHDLTLGDLLEGIVLHAFEGKAPFGPESIRRIADLRKVYGLELAAAHAHKLVETKALAAGRKKK